MSAPRIKPNASRSAGSNAMLQHLASIWPNSARRAKLISVFVQADPRAALTNRVESSLANLLKSGMLSSWGKGASREFSLGPAAQFNEPDSTAQAQDELQYIGVRVPARQSDVMHTSVYQPRPMQALRPGSDDFARLPSLRQGGQRLPFTGGYVGMSAGSKS